MILTLDLGSSTTKVSLWHPQAPVGTGGLVASAGTPVATDHPSPGRSEQDPGSWWTSLVGACDRIRTRHPEAFAAVEVIGCTGARQTVTLVGADARPLGPAIVWSDRRATAEADRLGDEAAGERPTPSTSGIPLDGASVAAKLAWLRDHEPDRVAAASWALAPRDLMVRWLTGVVATDASMASRSGLYLPDGRIDPILAGPSAGLLPPVVPSDRVTGRLTAPAARVLGLTPGTPVVIGAGDRACEVVGSGASESCPMVSWGTTANVSLPLVERPPTAPSGLILSRSATGGWLAEGGLSAAGSLMAWIGGLTGHSVATLAAKAGQTPPGARGVVVTPWLEGARAPWWQEDAGLGFVGLHAAHGAGDLARAAFEAVAWEVERCLEVAARRQLPGPPPTGLVLGGSGATVEAWVDVLTAITGLPASARRSGQAASAGAALLAARAVGIPCDLDRLDPVAPDRVDRAPDPDLVRTYRALRARSDRAVAAVLGLNSGQADGFGAPADDHGRGPRCG